MWAGKLGVRPGGQEPGSQGPGSGTRGSLQHLPSGGAPSLQVPPPTNTPGSDHRHLERSHTWAGRDPLGNQGNEAMRERFRNIVIRAAQNVPEERIKREFFKESTLVEEYKISKPKTWMYSDFLFRRRIIV